MRQRNNTSLYSEMLTIPMPEGYNRNFRPWHVEGLLSMGAQLVQRATEERAEFTDLVFQLAMIEDEIIRETNDLTFSEKRSIDGIRYGDEEFTRSDLAWREQSKGSFHGIYAVLSTTADTAAGKAALLRSQIEANSNDNLSRASEARLNGYTKEGEYIKEFCKSEIERIKIKKQKIDKLKLDERIDNLYERILKDYEQALNCLVPASEGLRDIFGYKIDLKEKLTYVSNFGPSYPISIFDELINWLRDANFWLAAFYENDQQFTMSLSLSAELQKGFAKAISGRKNSTASFDFSVSPEKFEHKIVRLRGVSVYAQVSSDKFKMWNAKISPPRSAVYVDFDGKRRTVSQDKIPAVYLGRVYQRWIPGAGEVLGAVSIGNCSPISESSEKWSLNFSCHPLYDDQFSTLQDIEVEFHLTGSTSD